jgi:hypothetical protein
MEPERMRTTMLLFLAGLLTVCATFSPSGRALAQGGRLVTEEELKKFESIGITEISKLMNGETAIGDKQKKEIALMAKYYVYYMTIPERQKDGKVGERRHEFKIRTETYIANPKLADKNKDFRDELCKQMIACFQEVFKKNVLGELENDMPSCVNAALLLPIFAKFDNAEITDFLAELVRDRGKPPGAWGVALAGLGVSPVGLGPLQMTTTGVTGRSYGKEDTIKLFALQGLATCFSRLHEDPAIQKFIAQGLMVPGQEQMDNAKRRKLADFVNPVIEYILNPPPLNSLAEADGFRYIRCEAIKALARFPLPYIPAAPDLKGNYGGIMSTPAYALMRVLADEKVLDQASDALDPESTLQEKLHAALGLCQMKSGGKLDFNKPARYNQELAVRLVGEFLVDFVNEFKKDHGKFEKDAAKYPPLLPWKVSARTVKMALADANFTDKAKKYIQDMENKIAPALQQIAMWKSVDAPSNLLGGLKPAEAVYTGTEYKIKVRSAEP